MMTDRRYPWAPLVAAMGVAESRAARSFGLGGGAMVRYRDRGLPLAVADRLATVAGFHPAEVWPSWAGDAEADARERRRKVARDSGRRRYRQDPDVAEAVRQRARAYYAEAGEYVRRRELARYWADPEAARAYRRERYQRNREVEVERARARRARAKGVVA